MKEKYINIKEKKEGNQKQKCYNNKGLFQNCYYKLKKKANFNRK